MANEKSDADAIQAHRMMLALAGMLMQNKPADVSVMDYLGHLRTQQAMINSASADGGLFGNDAQVANAWKLKHVQVTQTRVCAEEVLDGLRKHNEYLKKKLAGQKADHGIPAHLSEEEGMTYLEEENQRLKKEIAKLKAAAAASKTTGSTSGDKRKRLLSPLRTDNLPGNKGHGKSKTISLLHGDMESPSTIVSQESEPTPAEVELCLHHLFLFKFALEGGLEGVDSTASVLIALSKDCIAIFKVLAVGTDIVSDEARGRLAKAVFSKMLFGMGMLAESFDQAPHDRVVYHVAKMFTALIKIILESGSAPAKKAAGTTVANKGQKRVKLAEEATVNYSAALPSVLCNLFVALLDMLQVDVHQHSDIWDAILYQVLTHTGTMLGAFVFGGNGQLPAMVEAPVLVWLLRNVLHFYFKRNSPQTSGGAPPALGSVFHNSISTAAFGSMTSAAVGGLQETMLQAVFPNDHSFVNALSAPLSPHSESVGALPQIGQDDVPDWFKSEIWRILGWDILRRLVAYGP